jgi:hypothetical protein
MRLLQRSEFSTEEIAVVKDLEVQSLELETKSVEESQWEPRMVSGIQSHALDQ